MEWKKGHSKIDISRSPRHRFASQDYQRLHRVFLGAQQTIWIIKVLVMFGAKKQYAIKNKKKQAYKSQRVNPTKPCRDI